MSVLKNKRSESKAEYLNTAFTICSETMSFLKLLSARYSRLLAQDTMHLAVQVMTEAEKANSIFPSDETRKELRKRHLLEARASLLSLDVMLTLCYQSIMKNPEGAFTNSKGRTLESDESIKKIERMSENLGCLIDKENALLTKVLKSDNQR